ncbi:50S ribosomal protein L17p [Chitinispirillum alkaliphilum]|nr:50S ribosomal protein L17p [Chitinispirillum alkaliphilum]
MAMSILENERITTTQTKAKEVRGVVERLITYGKKGNLQGIRMAARKINDKTLLKKLFDDIAPSYKDREGGYTRIIKIGERKGDNAPMAIIELVGRGTPDAVRKNKKKGKAKSTTPKVEKVQTPVSEESKQAEPSDKGSEKEEK